MSPSAATSRTGASAEAIQAHYDLSNDFYALWLDENMVYSGALWRDGDGLAGAQVRKLDHHVAAAHAAGAAAVLEVGCGWGALLRRLVGHHGVERAVGLTLSRAQKEYVDALGLEGVDVRLESWQDHRADGHYDALVSIGALEHFARLEMTDSEKVAAYRRFFEKSHSLLRPRAFLSLQTFAYGSARPRAAAVEEESTQFLGQEIFRETDPPRLADLAAAIEGTFELVEMHNDRAGYARTCKAWLENLRTRRAEAEALVGEDVCERYERYLAYSFIGFTRGNLDLYRIALRRV